ncbi:MAG: DUF4124 domain-containing protein [Methylomonas sp.]|jgi:hypothetical protein
MRRTNAKKLVLFSLALVLNWESVWAKKLYRIIDENGNVYYSDHIKADQVQYHRETLTDNVTVIDVLEKAKNPEQLKLQKQMETLSHEHERMVLKQSANDRVLLSTYHNVEEIRTAMVNKLGMLDVQQKAIESNLQKYAQQLAQQHQQAAEFERNAQKLPDKLLTEIALSKKQIEDSEQELNQHIDNRKKTERDFKADIERYQFLTKSANVKSPESMQDDAGSVKILGLYICQDASQCDQAWKIAADYVAKYSTTERDVENDNLILRAEPVKDNDLSLSVSKLGQIGGKIQLFLDVRCRSTSIGKELCNSKQVQSMREEFAPFIQSKLTAH